MRKRREQKGSIVWCCGSQNNLGQPRRPQIYQYWGHLYQEAPQHTCQDDLKVNEQRARSAECC